MNSHDSLLDSSVLAEGPTRDSRFTVAEKWTDCANIPATDPEHLLEFFHRQMNEEVDSLECSARNLSDFPDANWKLRMEMAHQCADEARHSAMFRRIFESRGGKVGQYPVLNFQYRIITRIDSLVGRLAIQNRSFEAGGLDAIKSGIEDARKNGDEEMVNLFEAQGADEINHVRFANDWINTETSIDPLSVLQIGAALNSASRAFNLVMGPEATEGINYPADAAGRREAGFSEDEIELAVELQDQS